MKSTEIQGTLRLGEIITRTGEERSNQSGPAVGGLTHPHARTQKYTRFVRLDGLVLQETTPEKVPSQTA